MKDKKERKVKIRRFWKIKPVTKIKQSETVYSRTKEKEKTKEDLEKEL